jgi:ketosteroid isomerase-like protein
MLAAPDTLAIREIHDAWLAAELRGDAPEILDLCTEDVRWVPPSGPMLSGKRAANALLGANGPTIEEIRTLDLEVDGRGAIACKTCRYETRLRAPSGGVSQVARGRHLWVLRKELGVWKVAVVMWQPELTQD